MGATVSHIEIVDSTLQSVNSFLLAFILVHYLFVSIDSSKFNFQCLFLVHAITLLVSTVVNFLRYRSLASIGQYFMIGYVCIHLLFFALTVAVVSMKKKRAKPADRATPDTTTKLNAIEEDFVLTKDPIK